MIIDIRGTHGSGKSHVVRKLINDDAVGYICEDDVCLGTYIYGHKLAVLGKYTNVCGGCDQIKTADEVCRRVRLFQAEHGRVMLEGILVAHTFKRYSDLAKELGDYWFCFLDTPLDVCIERVRQRRRERGRHPDFDLFHITHDHHRIHKRLPGKFRGEGHNVVTLDWHDPMPQVRKLLDG